MRIIIQYLNDIDPVQQYVDYQMSFPWFSDQTSGGSGDTDWRERAINFAIDAKYAWSTTEAGVVSQLNAAGYTLDEIAKIFHRSVRWVKYKKREFKGRVINVEKSLFKRGN